MAVYTNLDATNDGKHGMFESSNIKSSIAGNLYSVLVKDGTGKAIAVDNGVAVKVGAYTGDGLEEREATIATAKQKVAIIGNPAVVKEAVTRGQGQPYNYQCPAGTDAKAYEVVKEDVFAVASYQIAKTGDEAVAVNDKIVVDGNGAYKVATTETTTTNGFVGRVHSIAAGTYYTMVRIEVLQNEDVQ